MTTPRFWIAAAPPQGQAVSIDDPREVHHALHVLRLKAGDACVACDSNGNEYHGRVTRIDARAVTLVVERARRPDEPAQPKLTLAQALPKLPAFESILRHATELGVTRILPLMTARSVVRISVSRRPAKCARWMRILREAAKQCRRSMVPELAAPLRWEEALEHPAMDQGWRLMLTLAVPAPPLAGVLAQLPRDGATVCIGPEGDFTVEEAAAFRQRGGIIASLGSRVLRTDTAAIAALAILQHEWSKHRAQGGE